MSTTAARKLAALVKVDNVWGKDPLIAAAEREQEKTVGCVLQEYISKKYDTNIADRTKHKVEKNVVDA